MTAVQGILAPYDPAGVARYEELRSEVWPVMRQVALRMEHVGSTAVEGLEAKPIIDADVVVEDREAAEEAVALLVNAGWEHLGDRGIPGREAFASRADLFPHHLYVVETSSPVYRNYVDLRDHLRDSPDARRIYQE